MERDGAGLLEAPTTHQRILGRYGGELAGPTLIALGGIHGTEPSGIRAATRLLERLGADAPRLRGRLVVLAGNLQALQRGCRFLRKDLNRQWTTDKVAALRAAASPEEPEDAEQLELLHTLEREIAAAAGPVYFLDLHTSSADGPPFLTIGDTLRNRAFAMNLPCPLILGLEEQVDGALLEYLNNLGHVTLGVEAGRHDLEQSAVHHEAVLWLALVAAGMLERADVPDAERWERILSESTAGIPRVIEVRHRHPVRHGDGFRMEPGFTNFQAVTKGQRLAHDRGGPITAREDGLILLPLYQGLGDDGFFLGRRVPVFWMRVSRALRGLRLDRLMHLLPGVTRHRELPRTLVVNTRIARFFPLQVFHLLGYRKRRQIGTTLLVTRRRFDIEGPEN